MKLEFSQAFKSLRYKHPYQITGGRGTWYMYTSSGLVVLSGADFGRTISEASVINRHLRHAEEGNVTYATYMEIN